MGAHSKGAKSSHWDMDYMTTEEIEKLFKKSDLGWFSRFSRIEKKNK